MVSIPLRQVNESSFLVFGKKFPKSTVKNWSDITFGKEIGDGAFGKVYKGFLHLSKHEMYVTFHEKQECVYDFPSLSLATHASADVSELVFKQEWRSQVWLKTILTHVAKDCDGNPYTHSCCSWKIIP